MKRVSALFVLFASMGSAYAQNPVSSLIQNLQSGAITQSISTIFGLNTILFLSFFAIFFATIQTSSKKMWPDMEHGIRNLMSIGASVALSYAFVFQVLAKVLPDTNKMVVAFVGLALAITFIVNKAINDKNEVGKFAISLFVGLLLSGLIIFGYNYFSGSNVTLPSFFGTKSDIRSRVISGGSSNDPNVNWGLAEAARAKHDYAQARYYYGLVAAAGNTPENLHWAAAGDQINMFGKDKLFAEEAQYYAKLFEVEYSAGDVLLTQAKTLPAGSPQQKQLFALAADQFSKIIQQKNDLCTELVKRDPQKAGAKCK